MKKKLIKMFSTLTFAPNSFKEPFTVEFVEFVFDFYKTLKICEKVVNDYPLTFEFVPDFHKT